MYHIKDGWLCFPPSEHNGGAAERFYHPLFGAFMAECLTGLNPPVGGMIPDQSTVLDEDAQWVRDELVGIYIQEGYMASGQMSLTNLAEAFDADRADWIVYQLLRARLAVLEQQEGKWYILLPAQERITLIQKHELATRWNEVSPHFLLGDTQGEVDRAYNALQMSFLL